MLCDGLRRRQDISTAPVRDSPVHTSNNVEATFDFVERIVRLVAFDNVASTMLLVWTELKALRMACVY